MLNIFSLSFIIYEGASLLLVNILFPLCYNNVTETKWCENESTSVKYNCYFVNIILCNVQATEEVYYGTRLKSVRHR